MLLYHLRYTLRTLRQAPLFATAAILTLALGIGATASIFTVVNTVMLRPLPFAQPQRLVQVAEKNDKLNLPYFGASVLNYLAWKEQTKTLDLALVGFANFNLTGAGDPEQYTGSTISPSLLPVLGLQPVLGRSFVDGEDVPGSPRVVLISEGLWKRRFGGEPGLLGRQIILNGVPHTVVGIAPAALPLLAPGDIWAPLIIDPAHEARLNHVVQAVGRIRPGVSLQQAQEEMDAIALRVARQYPEVRDWGIRLRQFYYWFVPEQLRTALLVLLGAVTLVLLIACANVANLLLSRAAARQKEIAVRTALGASRARLLEQLLTESLLLATAGGLAGLLSAVWSVRLMNLYLPANLLPLPEIAIDGSVLWFTFAVTLATAILFGMAPAWHASKSDLATSLRQGGRSAVSGTRPLLRSALVGAELALATLLLIGAGLLIQSLTRLQQVHLGFRPEGLLTFQVSLPPARYANTGKAWPLFRDLIASLEGLPGVRAAAVSSGIPFGGGNYTTTATAPLGKSVLPPGASVPIDWRNVSPGYFRTLEIPLLRGRYFTAQDDPSSAPVVIVSQATATRFWGAEDPLGRVIRVVGSGREFTVIGVVGDAHNATLSQDPAPAMYFSLAARQQALTDIAVRTTGNPESLLPGVRRRLHELDSELPVSNARTMDQWVAGSAAQPRVNAILLGIFAAVALLIAVIGIYGVLSYSVSRRTREIGLRMAIGAPRASVVRLVIGEGMAVALGGIVAGVAASLVLSRAVATLVFGIPVRDVATYAIVAGILAAVSLLACSIPALRAARVDPIIALRDE